MAKRKPRKKTGKKMPHKRPFRKAGRWVLWAVIAVAAFVVLVMGLYRVVNPPTTAYMLTEKFRTGAIDQRWVPIENIAPVMARAAVAAEDANFCQHWGFDVIAIRQAIADGGARGASTISQQTVKNVFLWHGRNYTRKALEALMTPVLEALWPKRRIIEVYLNVAEFDTGVFGVEAAAQHYFGVSAAALSDVQAARLAAILPNPKERSAAQPSDFVRKRARSILSGAATIDRDGRADCFKS